jgi:TetR/AcrR family transcriptional repressor of mexJK operon
MSASPTRPRPGRPRNADKAGRLEALFEVATDIFLENGFDGTSMALIARTAGASKETLYSHFGSKEALFARIIEALSERITRGLAARSGGC